MKLAVVIVIQLLFMLGLLLNSVYSSQDEQTCEESEDGQCAYDFEFDEQVDEEAPIPKGANPQGKPLEASAECIDRYDDCQFFFEEGECDNNPGWMIVNCAKVCNACHLRDPALRCDRSFLNISNDPIYAPGDMGDMFESIEKDFGHLYEINVLSRTPWIVTFDNFVTPEEAEALINSVGPFHRSTDTGERNEFGEQGQILSEGRTSSNAWCNDECEENEDVQNLIEKIEEVTRVPYSHYESFQVLKYITGQKYNLHHDSSDSDNQIPCGPRILTFFLYLSDVEEGGETAFPSLGIEVKPKKGKALLWPSTLNENPSKMDPNTYHEARPVIRGTKFAANAWIHLYDFRIPNLWGCTGSFDVL